MTDPQSDSVALENRAGICRITCGWKKPELALDTVCRYWRDVHSPGIARRPGLWEYRHFQYGPVRSDLFAPVPGIAVDCPPDQQLMWQSDVRYLDDAALALFGTQPPPAVLKKLLGDIDLIVDKSTTYRALGGHAVTLCDRSGEAAPQGPVRRPSYSLFFRQRGAEAPFRAALTALAQRWAATPGVVRVRLSLFEAPDMDAERKAGYPIKTHPVEMQYQALVDLAVESDAVCERLLAADPALDAATCIAAVHAYPVRVVYTSVQGGRPTLVGLRGYPAFEAMQALGAAHQQDPALLEWMYGPVARSAGGPAVPA